MATKHDKHLRRQLSDLAERLTEVETRLEAVADPAAMPTYVVAPLVAQLSADEASAEGVVVYGGSGPWVDGPVAWEMRHRWEDVRATAPGDDAAQLLAALGSTVRLRIVAALLAGTSTTAALTDLLGQPSPGQLFHHLRELLAAGIIHQPERGTYALRRQDVVPLLTVLAAIADVAGPTGILEPT